MLVRHGGFEYSNPMKSGDYQSDYSDDRVRGSHADIIFNNVPELHAYLHSSAEPTTLYHGNEDTLRFPVTEASIDFFRQGKDDVEILADVEFDSMVVNSQDIHPWQKFLAEKMTTTLQERDINILSVPHQMHDFYAILDDNYAAHVQFGAQTDTCFVALRLETIDKIHFSREEPNPVTDATPSDHYELLKSFLRIWSLALDKVTDELGEPNFDTKQKPHIVISPPSDFQFTLLRSTLDDEHSIPIPEIESRTSSNIGFNLIGGLTTAKDRLLDIADVYKDPVGAALYGVKGNHFILHGPPGTGKTSLVSAFAQEVGARMKKVDSTDIVDMWVGNSGKNIKRIFNSVKSYPADQLVVIFIDEFEAIAQKGTGGTSERVDVKKRLNLEIEDIRLNHPNIILAAATNADLDDLDPSLIRAGRLEPIGAPLPNEQERVDIWAAVMHQSILSFNNSEDIENFDLGNRIAVGFMPYDESINPLELAKLTDGLTGADFKLMLERARMKVFRHYRKTHEYVKVSQADLIREIQSRGR